jgi:urease accessory protein UreH
VDLRVRVADHCSAVLASQGSTKVFKNTRRATGADSSRAVDVAAASWHFMKATTEQPDIAAGAGAAAVEAALPARETAARATEASEAEQVMTCAVGRGALLAVLPQPVTAFRDARCRLMPSSAVSFGSVVSELPTSTHIRDENRSAKCPPGSP